MPLILKNGARGSIRAPKREFAVNGAITIKRGTAELTKTGSLGAYTLAAPLASDEGSRLVIQAMTAFAHTVTLTPGFDGAGSGRDVATFGGAVGDCLSLRASGGKWMVESVRNVTFA
jgi:hypothetical protein